jgi:WD40-like Beta Propeller Repeat
MGRKAPVVTAAAALVVVLGATGFLLSQGRPERRPASGIRSRPAAPPAPLIDSPGAIAFGQLVTHGSPTVDRTRAISVMLPGSPPREVLRAPACCLSWSPDGGRLLVTAALVGHRTQENIIAVNRGMFELGDRRLSLGPAVWMRDGKGIAAWATDPSDPRRDGVYTWRFDAARPVRLTHERGGRVQRPLAYSPDGSRLLVYEEGADPRRGMLATVAAAGGALQRINPPSTSVRCCFWGPPGTWSPDGLRISFAAFTGGRDNGEALLEVASATGGTVQPLGRAAWPSGARWSPTGRWIVYDSEDRADGGHDLYLLDPNGGGGRRLAAGDAREGACCPQWSPDGRALVYERDLSNDRMRLWLLNIDGSGVRALTRRPSGLMTFAWGR